jgi:hypothetical protein
MSAATPLPEGLVAFVKRDCPTCVLVQPVLKQLAQETQLTVITSPYQGSWSVALSYERLPIVWP